MKIKSSIGPIFLLLGDILILNLALGLTLILRYGAFPSQAVFLSHLQPFAFIFIIWLLVYFIYDLYSQQTVILQQKLSTLIFNAHLINSIIALAFFYFIPYFAITPKTNLFIFLVVSFGGLIIFRRYAIFAFNKQNETKVLFTCSAIEVDELINEFKMNHFYNVKVLNNDLKEEDITTLSPLVVINSHDSSFTGSLLNFYNMLFAGINFVTIDSLYEYVFGRIPISLISERWFLESISLSEKPIYDTVKRLMDFSLALSLALLSLVIYPLVYLLIKLDDGGEIFIKPKRVGKNNKLISLYKFRTMTVGNDGGKWDRVNNKVTRVGSFLRKTRIDELPQLWNVVFGDLSLIGPRPEFEPAVLKYHQAIKYYNVRHLIKPGLSGWAQIKQSGEPHHGINIDETKVKLSFDLYYVKHRNFLLDLKIALKTLRILLSRSGV